MKIHFLERDSRKNDADFRQTCGSFSVIQHTLEKGLRELGVYTDNIDEADHVGIADSLATDFNFTSYTTGPKKCFGIYFVDTINTIPEIALYRLSRNPNLKLFSINKHTAELYKKYGFDCTVIGPGIDNHYWAPEGTKFAKFTFVHSGFSNIRSGLDQLIQAYDLAFHGNDDVNLIIKDTSTNPKLKEKIASFNNKNIYHWTGRWTFDQLRDLYRSSHVLCSVFRHSGHGLGIGEAACVNTLPLVGNFAPSNEIMNGSFGALLSPEKEVPIMKIKGDLINKWGLTDTFNGLTFPEEPMVYSYNIEEYVHILRLIYENYYKYEVIRENCLKTWDYLSSTKNLLKGLDV